MDIYSELEKSHDEASNVDTVVESEEGETEMETAKLITGVERR